MYSVQLSVHLTLYPLTSFGRNSLNTVLSILKARIISVPSFSRVQFKHASELTIAASELSLSNNKKNISSYIINYHLFKKLFKGMIVLQYKCK